MLLRSLVILLIALAPAPALAQGETAQPSLWTRADGRLAHAAAQVSFPGRIGGMQLREEVEFSRHGEGVDTGLQYWADDRQVFATVYVYYPGLPHAGLAAWMTDRVIAMQGAADFRALGTRIADAGGREDVALRSDYAGFRDGMASSAAFIKVGRWIVKLRVSGPSARQPEVHGAMTVLRFRNDRTYARDTLRHSAEVHERGIRPLCDDARECRLAGAGRTPEDDRSDRIRLDQFTQCLPGPEQVLLSDVVVQRAGPHACSERSGSFGGAGRATFGGVRRASFGGAGRAGNPRRRGANGRPRDRRSFRRA